MLGFADGGFPLSPKPVSAVCKLSARMLFDLLKSSPSLPLCHVSTPFARSLKR